MKPIAVAGFMAVRPGTTRLNVSISAAHPMRTTTPTSSGIRLAAPAAARNASATRGRVSSGTKGEVAAAGGDWADGRTLARAIDTFRDSTRVRAAEALIFQLPATRFQLPAEVRRAWESPPRPQPSRISESDHSSYSWAEELYRSMNP